MLPNLLIAHSTVLKLSFLIEISALIISTKPFEFFKISFLAIFNLSIFLDEIKILAPN